MASAFTHRMTVAAAIEPGLVGVQATVRGGAPAGSEAFARVPGKESFRSGWQSLLVSLGAGIEQSGAGEPVPPGDAKGLGDAPAEVLEGASLLSLPSIAGRTQALKGEAGQVVLPKATASPRNMSGLRASISAGQILSRSSHHAAAAKMDSATAGSEEAPSATQRASTSKSAKPAASDTVILIEPQSSIPAQMALPSVVSTPETPNLTQASPPQIESMARTANQHKPADTGDLESPGLGMEALAFSKRDQLAGVRPARIAGARETVSGEASTTGKSVGKPEPDSLLDEPAKGLDESVKGSDAPGATATKSVSGVEAHIASRATQTLSRREAETGSQVRDSLTVPADADRSGPSVLAATAAGLQGSQPNAISSVAAKTNSSTDGRTSAAASIRLNRPSGTSAASQHGSNISQIQPVGQAQESSSPGLARDLAGLRGTAGTTNGGASETSTVIPGPATRDTFSALDAEPASRTSTWIHAGANRAEAGYQDPALGWVSVRANVGGGGIHASLVPTSMDAAQALGAHLAGLNAHLTEQHMPVETLTLAAPEGRGIDSGIDQSLNQNMHQGTGQGSEPNRQPGTGMEGASAAVSTSQVQSSVRGLEETILANRPAGSHISVMA